MFVALVTVSVKKSTPVDEQAGINEQVLLNQGVVAWRPLLFSLLGMLQRKALQHSITRYRSITRYLLLVFVVTLGILLVIFAP